MTLEAFPKHFTHTITAEVHADNDGRPWNVKIRNVGGLPDSALVEIAMEALNNWEGSCRPRWVLEHSTVEEEGSKIFNVLSATL